MNKIKVQKYPQVKSFPTEEDENNGWDSENNELIDVDERLDKEIKVWKTLRRVLISLGWRPIDGSSKIKILPSWTFPISEASFNLWASPPDRAGVASPKVK